MPAPRSARLSLARAARLLAPAVLAACSAGEAPNAAVVVDTLPGGIPRTMSSAPVDSGRWRLERAHTIAPDESAPGEILDPRDIAIADDGSVLLYDDGDDVVRVYNAQGDFVRGIGRRGQGPGEFEVGFIAVRGDTLAVQDPMSTRFTTFVWTDGRLLDTQRSVCCFWGPVGIDARGRAWLWSMQPNPDSTATNSQTFVRMSLGNRTADTIFAEERRGLPTPAEWEVRYGTSYFTMRVPMQAQTVFAVDPAHGMVTGWSGEYSLRLTRDGRDTIAIFGRTWTAEPLDASERGAIVDSAIARQRRGGGSEGPSEAALRQAFDPALLPTTRSAYVRVQVDRVGRRWVWRTRGDGADLLFDLFDSDGRWLDVVRLPHAEAPESPWTPVAWGRDVMAMVAEGEDGRPQLRVYRVLRQGE